jgi:hypothetical protein
MKEDEIKAAIFKLFCALSSSEPLVAAEPIVAETQDPMDESLEDVIIQSQDSIYDHSRLGYALTPSSFHLFLRLNDSR